MSEYTSGTQALQGRRVNHDPEPYIIDTGWLVIRSHYEAMTPVESCDHMPRPEYDVLDNQHLWWARWAFHDSRGPAERLDYYKDGRDWLNRKLDDQGHLSDEDEFARRVFTKLVAFA